VVLLTYSGSRPLIQFRNHFYSRTLGRVISPSQGHYLNTEHTHTHQTYMPLVRFEPTIPASERAKTVHALDRSPTMTGIIYLTYLLMELSPSWGEAKSAATQEFPSILWNPKVHYRVHKSLHWARSIQSIPSHPISVRSVLILSTHLRLGLNKIK
jgi:hypothetical protein